MSFHKISNLIPVQVRRRGVHQHRDHILCMFGKCLFLAFYMAWIYSIFYGVLLQCVLIMLAMEYFKET